MAQRVSIELVDDLDETPADETVVFGLDGANYEIDLTTAHANQLREALAQYVGVARKAGGKRNGRKASAAGSTSLGPSAREVRDWARSNNFDVPDRGRIPADVREAFDAAN